MRDQVAPDLRGFLTERPVASVPITRETIAEVRAGSNQRISQRKGFGSTEPEHIVADTPDGPLEMFVYHSDPGAFDPKPCMVWFHGGGYVMGQAAENWFGPLFAERAGCTVVSVQYRLAPEHPAPAATNDGFSALSWVYANAADLAVDPNRIAVGGASAGGGLAASVAIHSRNVSGPRPSFQLLLYPMLDFQHKTLSGLLQGHPVWPREHSLGCWDLYLGPNPDQTIIELVSAIHAPDLSDLPPTYISVGGVDLFVDECRAFHQRLLDAGGASMLEVTPGVYHGGESEGYETQTGRKMVDGYVDALKSALRPD